MTADRTQSYLGMFMESTGDFIASFDTKHDAQVWCKGRHEILARDGTIALRLVSAPIDISMWLDDPVTKPDVTWRCEHDDCRSFTHFGEHHKYDDCPVGMLNACYKMWDAFDDEGGDSLYAFALRRRTEVNTKFGSCE